jgi:hypothetical protein
MTCKYPKSSDILGIIANIYDRYPLPQTILLDMPC